ncbi:sigma 54-interacting transcriptional regulator [Mucilaginibacter sp. cycad4]|uniref:sigma-54-dependent Fis family transcriptional regulator n=1 Tax=Mucilaginibacter sp. cycad4 TaxID=3342096 RepID=UPI002AAAE34E|nr:sigma 54-interacting transcriptional regulator [Mucilaginibacter gossypii]WPU99129.1 sigma 54-interacting transcriptional regulator [Mucilaginibacter gossypii]
MSVLRALNKDLIIGKSANFALPALGAGALELNVFAIRTRQELNDFICRIANECSCMDTMFINLVDEDSQSHSTYFYYSREAQKVDASFGKVLDSAYPVYDGLFDVTLKNDFPVIWNLDEVRQWENIPQRVLNCNEPDLTMLVGLSLSDGVRKIGNMYWGYKNPGALSNEEMDTMRRVGPYIASAITMVRDWEETLRKVKENEAIISLVNGLFAANTKTALIAALNSGLKGLTDFNGLMVILNDPQEDPLNPYITYFDNNNRFSQDDGPLDPRPKKGDLKILKNVFAGDGPATWMINDLMKMPTRPDFITKHRGSKMKKVMGMPLHDKGDIKGALFLFSEKPGGFNDTDLKLLERAGQQIAKAVTNIRYLEEIRKKDDERSLFMAIGKAVSSAKNEEQLQLALTKVFAEVNFFDEGLIYSHPSVSGSFLPLVFKQTSSKVLNDNGLRGFEESEEPDHFLESIKKLKDITIFDIDNHFLGQRLPAYVAHWKANHIRSIVTAPFSDGGVAVGAVFFLSAESGDTLEQSLGLMNGIVAQVSTSVINFMTNERLTNKLIEINNSKGQLEIQNKYLQEEIHTTYNYSEIVGASAQMREVFYMVSQVSKTSSSVLILGETGTGKELIARAIHNTSQRKGKIMVKVNCGALPPNLIESELFGHERGSFTGATDRRIGKFELANNSTIFLDEIGELPMALQVKLLRALQEKEIERIGGRSSIKIDVRVIAASNRDLLKEVQQGNFRSDLYFRLNVFPISLPPLRDRKEDIPVLANHFAEKYAKRMTVSNGHFTARVMKQMIAYNWPGNVRELEHLVERSVLLTKGRVISQVYLPGSGAEGEEMPLQNADVKTLDEIEREHIVSVLKMVNGKISGVGGAAEMLKIPATTLASKIIRLNIKKGVS